MTAIEAPDRSGLCVRARQLAWATVIWNVIEEWVRRRVGREFASEAFTHASSVVVPVEAGIDERGRLGRA